MSESVASDGLLTAEGVHSLVRKHDSRGRELLYQLAGASDVEVAARGAYIEGLSGRRYLDFGSYAVHLLGHRPVPVIEAVANQLLTLPGSSKSFPNQADLGARVRIASLFPANLSKVMLLTTGAEAIEAALKLVRASTGRSLVHYFAGAFHGKTLGALSITDAKPFRDPFEAVLTSTLRLSRDSIDEVVCSARETRPAAIVVEAIQGEGGVYEFEDEFLRSIREICDEVGACMVCDEIQCGLGRSGELWGFSRSEVVPDVVVIGKALGGGVVPVSALIATREAFGPFDRDPLLHTSTFGGHPLGAAAAAATITTIEGEEVPKRARDLGCALKSELEGLVADWPTLFRGVRGRGLMLGLVCTTPDISALLIRSSLKGGVLVTPCLTSPQVVRVMPPAVIDRNDILLAREVWNRAALEVLDELKG